MHQQPQDTSAAMPRVDAALASPDNQGQTLRQRAEASLSTNGLQWPDNLQSLSPDEAQRLLHDLRVHQIELEMQNEELRRTQEELEISRARYFDLYDLAPVGYCTLSEAGLILEANLACGSLLGVARGTLIAQPLSRYILAEDADAFYLMRKQLLKTEQRQTCEIRMKPRADQPCWVHFTATVAEDAAGHVTFRVVLKEITERKLLEIQKERELVDLEALAAALKQTELVTNESLQRLRRIVDHLPAGAVMVEGDRLHFNSLVQAMLGYRDDELSTRSDWFSKLFPANPEQAQAGYERNRALGFPKACEVIATRKNGQPCWLIISSYVDALGEIWLLQDTTERHLIEGALREREVELAHVTRLCSLGEMVAEIAHEINQPLYAISNFAAACLTTLENFPAEEFVPQKSWLGKIQDQSEQAATIIRRLRKLAASAPLQTTTLNLSDVLQDALDILSDQARKSDIETRTEFPAVLPQATGDAVQMQQIFINLIKNAYESIDADCTVRIVTIRLIPQVKEFEVVVVDTGSGFSPEAELHKFEPFFTTKSRGLGMGLPICRSLIAAQGGRIWIQPAETRGAEIHFTIPRDFESPAELAK